MCARGREGVRAPGKTVPARENARPTASFVKKPPLNMNIKSKTPRPGFEPGSKAPQASRISSTLPGHKKKCRSPNYYAVLIKKGCSPEVKMFHGVFQERGDAGRHRAELHASRAHQHVHPRVVSGKLDLVIPGSTHKDLFLGISAVEFPKTLFRHNHPRLPVPDRHHKPRIFAREGLVCSLYIPSSRSRSLHAWSS